MKDDAQWCMPTVPEGSKNRLLILAKLNNDCMKMSSTLRLFICRYFYDHNMKLTANLYCSLQSPKSTVGWYQVDLFRIPFPSLLKQ